SLYPSHSAAMAAPAIQSAAKRAAPMDSALTARISFKDTDGRGSRTNHPGWVAAAVAGHIGCWWTTLLTEPPLPVARQPGARLRRRSPARATRSPVDSPPPGTTSARRGRELGQEIG